MLVLGSDSAERSQRHKKRLSLNFRHMKINPTNRSVKQESPTVLQRLAAYGRIGYGR
jgi:hypothetical protein